MRGEAEGRRDGVDIDVIAEEETSEVGLKREEVVVRDPRELSPEKIEASKKMVESEAADIEGLKNQALHEYRQAQGQYNRYFEDRKLLMETKDSLELTRNLRKLNNQIALVEDELNRAKSAFEHASRWSYKYKKKLLKERHELEDKGKELKQQADEMKALIPKVAEAEKYVRENDELKLKAEMTKAKIEAEKY